MKLKKFAKSILYPHVAVMLILLAISIICVVYSMVCIGVKSISTYLSLSLATYTLLVWCLRLPTVIRFLKRIKTENKYVRQLLADVHLRSSIALYGSSLLNALYAILQLSLGFYHQTFWYCSLGCYYICLAVMRFYLVSYLRKNKPGEKSGAELKRYRICGWIFLAMNVTLAVMTVFMVYWNRTLRHHMIIAIAMAAYTFTTFTVAIVNLIRYRRYNNPILSASKNINMAAACVSMLTLESTMLATFDDGSMSLGSQRALLGATGGIVCAFVITMAVIMIVKSTKKIKETQVHKEKTNGE